MHLTTDEQRKLRSAYLAYRRRELATDEAIDTAIDAIMPDSRSVDELRDQARTFLTAIERANTTTWVE